MDKSNILVAVICCKYKLPTLNQCLKAIKNAGFTEVLLNYEGHHTDFYNTEEDTFLVKQVIDEPKYLQVWNWQGAGKVAREFDQHQAARLTPICMARNMCLDFAQHKEFEWIFFCDSDCIMPKNVMEIFDSPYKLKGGLIPGRGVHSHVFYYEKPDYHNEKGDFVPCANGSCGSLAIHKDLFYRLRFRWGMPIGSEQISSEDPLFASDALHIFGEKWWVNRQVRYTHIGDLAENETAR